MRYVRALSGLVLAASSGALVFACGDRASETAPPPGAVVTTGDAGDGAPSPRCGEEDAEGLPFTRDEGSRSVTVACEGQATELAVSTIGEGLVRLRYGKDARGSIAGVVAAAPDAEPLRLGRRGSALVVCTTALEVTFVPGACRVRATDVATGAVLLDDGDQGGVRRAKRVARGKSAPDDVLTVVRPSPAGERFYGLGHHTAASRGLDLRGSVVDLYNTDAYDNAAGGFRPDANPLYESIPFYVGLREKIAYGVFTDNTFRLQVDFAKTVGDAVAIAAWGGAIDQVLVAGPRIADVLRRYTALTGRTPLPAPWTLGLHQSRWEGPCDGSPAERPFCSATQIEGVVKTFRDQRVPLDGVFLDIQHMDGFRSFTFDKARFADPAALTTALAAQHVRASTIVDPGIKVDPAWDVYQAGLAGGHFLRAPGAASPFEGEVWPGASVFPDFTSPAARAWWSGLVAGSAERGIAGMWIDMNEPSSFTSGTVPDTLAVAGDGRPTTMAEAHNVYGFFEARATYEGLLAARPAERPFLLSRAAFAGQQRWSAVWTGDAPSTWTTLAGTLPQLLSLGLSGMTFAGSDVGGYSGREESTSDLYSRWMALGAVSPFFRVHAEKDARRQEPWAFGEPVLDATRELVSLRYELFPYLYAVFDEASRTGAPVLRPLVFEFQDDPATHTIADEAMLGPSLLVAPVVAKAATTREIYLPPGTWTELRSGAVLTGGGKTTIATTPEWLPKDTLPLYAREGAILPRTPGIQHTGERDAAPLVIDVFPARAKSTFVLHEDDGTRGGPSSRITFTLARTTEGARFEGSAREGAYVAPHAKVVVRVRGVASAPTSVRLSGQPLDAETFAWDAADRSLSVTLPSAAVPFVLEVAYAAEATPADNGMVDVPVRVKLPPGTEAAAIASSATNWTHVPLVRSGDEATGTIRVPRGGFAFYKVTRGSWPTVERTAGCAEIENRHVLGAAKPASITVAAWADRCP